MNDESCVLRKHVFGVVVSCRVSQNGVSSDAPTLGISARAVMRCSCASQNC
jgi:hypothetical protein